MEQKTFIEASCIFKILTGEKNILWLLLLKVCESFRFGELKKLEVYFGLYGSSIFIENRRPIKYYLCEI